MKRLLREPLLHFLVLGAALFAAFSVINRAADNRTDRIVISAGRIEHLTAGFTRTWRRPPTAEELNGLIRDHVREEVFYREAKAIGLDRDDPVIRRRLQQKLEFISEDIEAQAEPTDADLATLLESHPDRFRLPRSYTFSHVYLNPERHSADLTASVLLAKLRDQGRAADISTIGDRFLPGSKFDSIPASEVAKVFGAEFESRLGELTLGQWQGPVRSGYGVHLVLMEERAGGRLPEFAEARQQLRREWKETRRRKANEEFFRKLSERYTITIEAVPAIPAVDGSDRRSLVQR